MSTRSQDRTSKASPDDEEASKGVKRPSPIRRFFKILGPGLITGASDDDPSGIATYAQAGATFNYSMLWTVPLSLPMMMAVQEICDRTATATGESLGALARRKFGRGMRVVIGVLLVALMIANCLNLAADLMAIGQGMQLLHAGPAPLWSAIAGVAIVIIMLAGSFSIVTKIFKWLCVSLLAYVAVLFATHVKWGEVLAGSLGAQFQLSPHYLGLIVAVLGTTISPYLFFWQSANRIEEMRAEGDDDETHSLKERPHQEAKLKLRHTRLDVFTGMFFSVLVMFAIMTATAATLGANGKSINSAADAAKALEPIAGPAASALFAIGFIGAGMLAVPVLAAAGSAGLAALLDKKWGLDRGPRSAPVFYALIGVGTIAGTLLSVFATNPIGLLVFSALVNGIAATPFLIVIMLIARDRKIMGEYRNGKLATFLGWAVTAIMLVAGAIGIWQVFAGG
jgi:NRAMP (natural resistance-associated macrophage protein)-like metal ion transporter